jgi:hypothetical protein
MLILDGPWERRVETVLAHIHGPQTQDPAAPRS